MYKKLTSVFSVKSILLLTVIYYLFFIFAKILKNGIRREITSFY